MWQYLHLQINTSSISVKEIAVGKKRGNYLNFQDSVKYWYFPENTGKKSKTTYFILLIKSVGMNTVVHLVSNMTFNHLSLIFTSFGYPVMHWAFT